VRLKHSSLWGRESHQEFQTNSREVEARISSSPFWFVIAFQTNSREVEAVYILLNLLLSGWFQTNSREVEASSDTPPQTEGFHVSDELS